ncbi:hypothetical protein JOF48_000783 [Arthrobacter stackebrandtii]|uniref:Uncharacterized protein n=1 Tax=Arthrobacter stackebrandtii TaxID=272161 RepID=A0ABS4YT61_9MICC|nr:hypothetical protein [Arthrobacter stackebrandtii]MBP2411984.1 hypothetical protein [Arthrobacter stackebrandtii]
MAHGQPFDGGRLVSIIAGVGGTWLPGVNGPRRDAASQRVGTATILWTPERPATVEIPVIP